MIRAIRDKKSLIPAVLALLGCIFFVLPVLAGEGDGSGGGQGVPLTLVSSSPANGQKNVAVTTDISLTFNKNVVNLAVKDNNMSCFSLFANGANIPIKVNMPDDQVDVEHKRNVYIDPVQDLQPGTEYQLIISGQLKAKSGVTLGSPVTITFSTAGGAAHQPANTQDSQNLPNQTLSSDNRIKPDSNSPNGALPATEQVAGQASPEDPQDASSDTEEKALAAADKSKTASLDTEEKAKAQSTQKPKKQDERESKGNNRAIALAAGIVIVAAGGYAYYRYSHKK
ncbi:MAG: Ig-like domain-containing protein [Syntrophomonadaceae bacterium]